MPNSTGMPAVMTRPSFSNISYNSSSSVMVPTSLSPHADSRIEAWQLVLPLVIVLFVALIITVLLVLVIIANHKQQRNAVFPVVEETFEDESLSEERSEWIHSRKVSLEDSLSDSDDLAVTRTKSLTLVIPRGECDR